MCESETNDQVINPKLFQALQKACGTVKVLNPQVDRKVRYARKGNPGHYQAEVIEYGEQYEINCPFCDDKRSRCRVNHWYGIFDKKTKSRNRHSFHCFHEKCHKDPANWEKFYRLLEDAGYRSRTAYITRPSGGDQDSDVSPKAACLPDNLTPLHLLPNDHPAIAYVRGRDLDPVELSMRWGVTYCEENDSVAIEFKDPRIVIPIYCLPTDSPSEIPGPTDLLGWQARSIDGNRKKGKYLFMKGTPKGEVLYGLSEALAVTGPLIISEGVVDCWAIGPGAVALFGNALSQRQEHLLKKHCSDRPIVVMLDVKASDEAKAICRKLRGRVGGKVVIANVPEGYDDPGECPRKKLLVSIAEALDCSPKELRRRYACYVVGERMQLTAKSIIGLGESVCVAYSAASDNSITMAMAGDDLRSRIFAKPSPRVFKAIDCHRVYFNALEAQRSEHSAGLPVANTFDCMRTVAKLLEHSGADDLASLSRSLVKSSEQTPLGTTIGVANPETRKVLTTAGQIRQIWDEGSLLARIQDEGLGYVYESIEKPVIALTAAMVQRGIRVDVSELERRLKTYDPVEQESQLQHAEQLHRYLDATTGRVHCKLDPLGAVTGRYTSTCPNLLALHRDLKDILIPDAGFSFIEADFSHFELRVLAELSQDERLLNAIDTEQDLHTLTAAAVLGIVPDEVGESQRQLGKKVNFAITYGQTAFGLADDLEISRPDAEHILECYQAAHAGVERWSQSLLERARTDGYVTTLYGRRRHLPDINSMDNAKAAGASRQAINTVVQGTAADINKLALIRLHKWLPDDCHLLLTVHDSVLLQVPQAKAKKVARKVEAIMQKAPPKFSLPLVVEVGIGRNWAECKP